MSDVLILDDDEDTLASLGDAFVHYGYAPCSVRSFRELVTRRDDALSCRCAILDVNLGLGPSGVDACEWLRREGFAGEVVFLTGHGMDHPLVRRASAAPKTRILRKPSSLEELLAFVKGGGGALSRPTGGASSGVA